jgi:hypothetical protein
MYNARTLFGEYNRNTTYHVFTKEQNTIRRKPEKWKGPAKARKGAG